MLHVPWLEDLRVSAPRSWVTAMSLVGREGAESDEDPPTFPEDALTLEPGEAEEPSKGAQRCGVQFEDPQRRTGVSSGTVQQRAETFGVLFRARSEATSTRSTKRSTMTKFFAEVMDVDSESSSCDDELEVGSLRPAVRTLSPCVRSSSTQRRSP